MKKKDFAIAAFILLMGGTLFLWLYFRAALAQERDTPDVIKAAVKLELTSADVVPIHDNPNRLIIRAGSLGFKTYLEQQGWVEVDRLGALRVYRRGTQRLHAYCDMFSTRYAICKIYPNP
ncbi:MAG TPA: hypothetical protein VL134_04100 [Leptolyngbya sp.]|jgi:hypothetical protein|nr:hypothetical protein [Leptolyngbya sp.]